MLSKSLSRSVQTFQSAGRNRTLCWEVFEIRLLYKVFCFFFLAETMFCTEVYHLFVICILQCIIMFDLMLACICMPKSNIMTIEARLGAFSAHQFSVFFQTLAIFSYYRSRLYASILIVWQHVAGICPYQTCSCIWHYYWQSDGVGWEIFQFSLLINLSSLV